MVKFWILYLIGILGALGGIRIYPWLYKHNIRTYVIAILLWPGCTAAAIMDLGAIAIVWIKEKLNG